MSHGPGRRRRRASTSRAIGPGHALLSSHVTHRANIAALAQAGVAGVLAVTVCGAVDPSVPLGSLICFDDLHFLANRLPDGSLCTFFDRAGDPRRGHWIYADPYAPALRSALVGGARGGGLPLRDGGCYGHVDGPRFNTRAEIRGLAVAGVTAVSQTAGPETVLAGEAELPFALVGYATDYANGVHAEPTPVARLLELIAASTDVVRAAARRRAPALAAIGARADRHRLPLPRRGVTAGPTALVFVRAPRAGTGQARARATARAGGLRARCRPCSCAGRRRGRGPPHPARPGWPSSRPMRWTRSRRSSAAASRSSRRPAATCASGSPPRSRARAAARC